MARSPGLVVMGENSCSRGDQGSNPSTRYHMDYMDIFSH